MRVPSILSALFLVSPLGLITPESFAGEHPDGTRFFEAAPRLGKAKTTFNAVRMRGATYYFTIILPSEAREPLGKIIITQKNGIDDIPLLLNETEAFIGTPNDQQEMISLADVFQSKDNREITVNFVTPVAPSNTITVGLKPRKNPKFSGVYLFGVTVFPAGEKSQELYLGVRRLQFYDRDHDSDFRFP